MAEDSINDKLGHRQRVKQRFLNDDGNNMADYELLEFLLMQAIPRRDVKPIAKELLRRFGSFAEVVFASPQELMKTKWVKDNVCVLFKLIAAAVKRICLQNLKDNSAPLLLNTEAVIEYCRATMAYAEVEELHVMFLDNSMQLLSVQLLQKGSLTGVAVSPREIIKTALEQKASNIIMVHNHPSDNIRPSENDIYVTGQVEKACDLMGIKLQDHIIIGKSDFFSFLKHKMLNCLTRA